MGVYHHLKEDERIWIEVLVAEGYGTREIAGRLSRSPSTVSREVRRGAWVLKGYTAKHAQWAADERLNKRGKPPPRLAVGSPELEFVLEKLREGWSPFLIAGRFRLLHPGSSLCAETIYRYIYARKQAHLRLHDYLPQHRLRRRKRGKGRKGRNRIPHRVGIEERPQSANDRTELGHMECDLVCFSEGNGVICHLVERKSRYGIAVKLADKSAEGARLALLRRLRRLPRGMVRSITFDNGLEFAQHYILRERLGITTYFCHPYSSWEKGAVEYQNSRLRRYLPRNTDLSQLPQSELNDIRNELNNRPMAVLGFKTPKEVLRCELTRSVALHL